MISVDEALERVLAAAAAAGPLPDEEAPLHEAAGRILRETVLADRDLPPFTRSAMDGYALRAADVARVPATLEVVEEIPAGRPPSRRVDAGQASRIMTGAALPEGADAVQMVEKCETLDGGRVRVLETVPAGEHVRRSGEELARGAVLIEQGAALGPARIGLLATAGRPRVRVARRPRAVIIPTGDELVEVDREPAASQIRESNGRVLESLVRLAGGEPDRRAIARDTVEDLRAAIAGAIGGADLLLMSGGVSMGDYDLVGGVLRRMGCRPAFDRVAVQPGKPLFFGTMPRPAGSGEGGDLLVFGLPGNPVSTVVDFLLFARPAMKKMMGASRWLDPIVTARLAAPVDRRPGRRAYLPAVLSERDGETWAELLPSRGSADMVALAAAGALAILPETASRLDAGVRVRALPLAGLTMA